MTTVVELRKEAKAKGIKGYSKMNKAQLCAALNGGNDSQIKFFNIPLE